jgi:hypothetical protein
MRYSPLVLLALGALAFAVWMWLNSVPTDRPRIEGERPPEVARNAARPSLDDAPPDANSQEQKVQGLLNLKPGMLQAEVKGLIGAPGPKDVHPARVTDGRVTYQIAYEADLEPPPTVRPIRLHRPAARDPRMLVILEFDATKPGHPLLAVRYPDPLF